MAVGALSIFAATAAYSQNWEYQSYYSPERNSAYNTSDKIQAVGYITLDESGEKPVLRIVAGRIADCFSGLLEVQVEKQPISPRLQFRQS